MKVSIVPANDKVHKYKATFIDELKDIKRTIYFGAKGMGDYIKYSKEGSDIGEKHKELYLARHSARENWNDPMTAGALSRWILWNLPTFDASVADFRRRFGLQAL